ncbi:MAG: LacI family DNA-binding transcriptional regulator [Liquorilactobacillus hordei]|uniref:LacI family DNA-binding transcriptional regulator n=1 Tax=Liquorilactobacillus hordei TaxID=468911 RepID=UPI0039E7AA3B
MTNINDVAHLAGVSRGSVSNYLNGAKMRAVTAKKIAQAIAELDYLPNGTAQALKKKQTRYAVLILPEINTPFFADLTEKIQAEFRKKDFSLILCTSNNQSALEIKYLKMAQVQKVAGIITMSYSDIRPWLNANIPLVTLEHSLTEQVPLVTSDNYTGGRIASQKLRALGAKKLLFLGTKPIENSSWERRQGFLDDCELHQCTAQQMLLSANNSLAMLKDFVNDNFSPSKNNFDGIFAENDAVAYSCWRILQQKNISIPAQVQIIGFDGAPCYGNQPLLLSSIKQPTSLLAKAAVENLFNLIKHSPISNKKVLPVSFVEGITTKETL